MMNALKDIHDQLIGPVETTSIQARIFHEVSLMGILALPVSLFVNFFIGVPYVNVILIVTVICIGALYYNSRYLGNLNSSVIIFTIFSNLLLAINYCFNSGIAGPTLLLFLLSVVFTVAVVPRRKSLVWILVNALVVTIMLYLEYSYPQLIRNTYVSREGFFIDTLTSYLAVILCIIVVLSYLIKSQHIEKMKAVHASIALQEANDSKTKLLSILSHDLRSPLNSIQSFLEILVEFDLEEQERKAIKAKLLKETKSTQDMLYNLLSWTKAQMEGGVKVNLVVVNLFNVINSCIDIQRAAALEKSITMHNNISPQLNVLADVDMLKLVVRNLFNNSIKFTKSGGEVIVTSDVDNSSGILIIADNGIGMEKDKRERIFTLNSDSTYGTNNEKGVGLGLLLCKEFTELQNGRITLVNSSGSGTAFSLHFPIA
jgi:two-component system sensor histidine kinase/response regulator